MPEGSSGSRFCYLWPFPGSCTRGPKWNWNSWIPQLDQLYWPSHPHSLLHSYFYYKSFQTTRLTAQCYPISWDTSCYIELPLFFPFCLSSPFFPLNLQLNSLGNSPSMVHDFFFEFEKEPGGTWFSGSFEWPWVSHELKAHTRAKEVSAGLKKTSKLPLNSVTAIYSTRMLYKVLKAIWRWFMDYKKIFPSSCTKYNISYKIPEYRLLQFSMGTL